MVAACASQFVNMAPRLTFDAGSLRLLPFTRATSGDAYVFKLSEI